jgi:hypothetical protein
MLRWCLPADQKKSPVIASCSRATTDDKPCDRVAGFHGDFPAPAMGVSMSMEISKSLDGLHGKSQSKIAKMDDN